MLPAGTRYYQYLIALDGATLIAATYGSSDYARNKRVLDAMMATLEFTSDGSSQPAKPPPKR